MNGVAAGNSITMLVTLCTITDATDDDDKDAGNLFDIHVNEGNLHEEMEDCLGELNDYSAKLALLSIVIFTWRGN